MASPHAEVRRFGDQLCAMAPEDRALALARLAGILAENERLEDLRHLLSTYPYLDAKLRSLGPQALIDDFDRYAAAAGPGDRDLASLRNALALSAESLVDNPAELPSQLLGRLEPDTGNREALLQQMRVSASEP